MAGAIPIPVPISANNDYQPTRSDLMARVSPRTKMLVVTTPNTPSGSILTINALQTLATFAIEHRLWVISDEIYEKLIYENNQHIIVNFL